MTDRELLAALYEQQGRILAHAGVTSRKLDEVAAAQNDQAHTVARIEARLAAQDQRCVDHHRRTAELEQWRARQTRSVSDSQQNDITELKAALAQRDADKAKRRAKALAWAAGVLGGLIVAGGGTLITLSMNGCF